MRRWAWILIAIGLGCAMACGGADSGSLPKVAFVHATDPHMLLTPPPPNAVADNRARVRAQKLSYKAFATMMKQLGSLPDEPVAPSFLVLTGDLGLENLPAAGGDRTTLVKRIAEALTAPCASIKDIYFVLGNNDVVNEEASDGTVKQAQLALGEIQSALAGSGITLHDLTSCYETQGQAPVGCTADIADTPYRLIGFPSYSFKAKPRGSHALWDTQARQMATFGGLIAKARAAGRRALVLSHVPEIDDPYTVGQDVFADALDKVQEAADERPKYSTWDVSPEVFRRWKQLVESSDVAAVLAGHLHDSHKEVYYAPYSWSTRPPLRADLDKLLIAPPLSVKNQTNSPIQARGFSVVHLGDDHVSRRLFWYDPGADTFRPAPQRASATARQSSRSITNVPGWWWDKISTGMQWLWSLWSDINSLNRAMVLMLALVAAFLTVVGVWQIPWAPSAVAPSPAASSGTAPAGGAAGAGTQSAALTGTSPALLAISQSNFARTVIAGLGSLVVISGLEATFFDKIEASKPFYLVMFVVFFLVLLFISAVLRGLGEALRSRVVLPYRPQPGWHGKGVDWVRYWCLRFLRWLRSYGTTLLFFWDTFYNVIQGKNQLQTAIFQDEIIKLQESIVRTTHRVRTAIDLTVQKTLKDACASKPGCKPEDITDELYRVNVSVLSDDLASLFYISWERGSLMRSFDQHSVAWMVAYTGEARWWRAGYADDLVLFDNHDRRIPVSDDQITLKKYLQVRQQSDYEAFVVLPFPSARDIFGEGFRKGAIHISFKDKSHMESLWPEEILEPKPGQATPGNSAAPGSADRFREAGSLLQTVKDPALKAVLSESIEVLSEALRGFNETIYHSYIRPNQRT
jgi:hypothetical protein